MLKNKKMRLTLSMLLLLSLLFPFFKTTPVHAAGINTGIIAVSNVGQTVYTGPGTDYVSVGSISYGERVYIMDKEPGLGWYRIVYDVNNSSAQKAGYVPTSSLDLLIGNPSEANYSEGYHAFSSSSQKVYSSPTMDLSNGSINYQEGITVFYSYTPSNYPNRTAYFIEYSTSSGPKRGYIMGDIIPNSGSGVARVKSRGDLYYGPNTSSYGVAGTVFANETVTVIEKNGDWVCVEYNTTKGRKRGYFSQGHLQLYRPSGYYYAEIPFFIYGPTTNVIDARQNVHSGPSSAYPVIGYVENENVKNYGYDGPNGCTFIQYNTSSGLKTGYLVH